MIKIAIVSLMIGYFFGAPAATCAFFALGLLPMAGDEL